MYREIDVVFWEEWIGASESARLTGWVELILICFKAVQAVASTQQVTWSILVGGMWLRRSGYLRP